MTDVMAQFMEVPTKVRGYTLPASSCFWQFSAALKLTATAHHPYQLASACCHTVAIAC